MAHNTGQQDPGAETLLADGIFQIAHLKECVKNSTQESSEAFK